jgi:hypothetical protein
MRENQSSAAQHPSAKHPAEEIKLSASQQNSAQKDASHRQVLPAARQVPVLLSIDKAAKISGLGRNNLAYLIKYHKLPVVKLPGYNRIKIHYDDLINFIENNKCVYAKHPADKSSPLTKNKRANAQHLSAQHPSEENSPSAKHPLDKADLQKNVIISQTPPVKS